MTAITDEDLEEIYNAAIDGDGKTAFDGLRAVAAKAVEMAGWISVNDRLPEYEKNVLVTFPDGTINVGSIWDAGEGYLWGTANRTGGDLCDAECLIDDEYLPTHWMPIMASPNEK